MKNLKILTAKSDIDYDRMTNNVEQLKELAAKVEDIKRNKQKKIEEREAAIKKREKKERKTEQTNRFLR